MARSEVTIDWNKVNEFLAAGCSGCEIASEFGIHHDTLYDRTVKEFNKSFTDYSAEKRSKGDARLRLVQYQKAIKGDNTQLIWLGKQRLGQREPKEEFDQNKHITVKLVDARSDNTSQVQMPAVSG